MLLSLSGGLASAQPRELEARYSVEASILLFGVAIFHRAHVGEALLRWRSAGQETSVEFQAGSLPERARGLNRLGYFLERATPRDADYFGFMTSSKEESLASARKAMESQGADLIPYSASEGRVTTDGLRCRIAQLALPSRLSFRELATLLPLVRAAFASAPDAHTEERRSNFPAGTFLRTVMEASCRDGRSSLDYSFNSKRFTLRGACAADGPLRRLDGEISAWETGRKTTFQLWREPGAHPALPERFEYQAKSFLRLSFRRDSPA
jgi:hypothetical protein